MRLRHWVVFVAALIYAAFIVYVIATDADIRWMCEGVMVDSDVCVEVK